MLTRQQKRRLEAESSDYFAESPDLAVMAPPPKRRRKNEITPTTQSTTRYRGTPSPRVSTATSVPGIKHGCKNLLHETPKLFAGSYKTSTYGQTSDEIILTVRSTRTIAIATRRLKFASPGENSIRTQEVKQLTFTTTQETTSTKPTDTPSKCNYRACDRYFKRQLDEMRDTSFEESIMIKGKPKLKKAKLCPLSDSMLEVFYVDDDDSCDEGDSSILDVFSSSVLSDADDDTEVFFDVSGISATGSENLDLLISLLDDYDDSQ